MAPPFRVFVLDMESVLVMGNDTKKKNNTKELEATQNELALGIHKFQLPMPAYFKAMQKDIKTVLMILEYH